MASRSPANIIPSVILWNMMVWWRVAQLWCLVPTVYAAWFQLRISTDFLLSVKYKTILKLGERGPFSPTSSTTFFLLNFFLFFLFFSWSSVPLHHLFFYSVVCSQVSLLYPYCFVYSFFPNALPLCQLLISSMFVLKCSLILLPLQEDGILLCILLSFQASWFPRIQPFHCCMHSSPRVGPFPWFMCGVLTFAGWRSSVRALWLPNMHLYGSCEKAEPRMPVPWSKDTHSCGGYT